MAYVRESVLDYVNLRRERGASASSVFDNVQKQSDYGSNQQHTQHTTHATMAALLRLSCGRLVTREYLSCVENSKQVIVMDRDWRRAEFLFENERN